MHEFHSEEGGLIKLAPLPFDRAGKSQTKFADVCSILTFCRVMSRYDGRVPVQLFVTDGPLDWPTWMNGATTHHHHPLLTIVVLCRTISEELDGLVSFRSYPTPPISAYHSGSHGLRALDNAGN